MEETKIEEMSISEQIENMPLEMWEKGMREFCGSHTLEEIDHKLDVLRASLSPDSLRLKFTEMMRELYLVSNVWNKEASHEAMRAFIANYIETAKAYYAPYYTEEAYREPEILPREYRAAFYLAKILQAEEKKDLAELKDLTEPCILALPVFRDTILKYMKTIAESMEQEEHAVQDEMEYLAAQLRKKAKELQAMGQEDAAQQILDQLKLLGK